jgi:hypothetical protein
VTGIMLVGMALIVGGIAILNRRMRQPEQSSTSA